MSDSIYVIKFGGAVLQNKQGFQSMARIIASYSSCKLLVVVSAFSRSTRMLERAAQYAESGQQELALATAQTVIDEHITISREILQSEQTASALHHLVVEGAGKIRELLRGVAITRELTARTRDYILSYGEYFALHIVKHFCLEQQLAVKIQDATSFIITDSNFGSAKPIEEPTKRRIQSQVLPALQQGSIILTQGFVGADIHGNITTMGKESSNYTATFIGSLLQAREVCIYTDVNGICTADPHIIPDCSTIPALSYKQALLAAHNGLKLLYPTMIEPLVEHNIPLRINNALHENSEGTLITNNESKFEGIISVRHLVGAALTPHFTTEMSIITFIGIPADKVLNVLRDYNSEQWNTIPFSLHLDSSGTVQTITLPASKVHDVLQFSYATIFGDR
ncbi:MAG TPA: aspartate kinase [Candidatus Kapabacteria bacterium]|jgi:aspartate kinase|nr:aspartate kinase [Ignavibacteria bacterium]HRK59708.1 aspartate kinase [Candidatus Kapabacteria bacterium]